MSAPGVPLGGSGQAVVRVSADDYLDVLGDQALLSVTVLALVEETEQSWVGKQPYRLRRPDLDVSIDGQAGEGCLEGVRCLITSCVTPGTHAREPARLFDRP